jgi:hypothetical protein
MKFISSSIIASLAVASAFGQFGTKPLTPDTFYINDGKFASGTSGNLATLDRKYLIIQGMPDPSPMARYQMKASVDFDVTPRLSPTFDRSAFVTFKLAHGSDFQADMDVQAYNFRTHSWESLQALPPTTANGLQNSTFRMKMMDYWCGDCDRMRVRVTWTGAFNNVWIDQATWELPRR